TEQLDFFVKLVEEFQLEHEIPVEKIAAALAHLSQGDNPLLLQARPQVKSEKFRDDNRSTRNKRERGERNERHSRDEEHNDRKQRPFRKDGPPEKGMERFRVEVGREHGVKPGNIVGAIANEAGVDGEHIGRINIQDDFSLLDLPEGMPKDIFNDLKNVRVAGQKLAISRLEQPHKKHFSRSKGKGGGHKAHKGKADRSKHRKGPKRN
ncbi:MAG: ATP-dependent helicase, partial [Desulfobacterales bacterium]|nr:ATP-dependent helicase [Desulfobacterales bacterium]